MARHLTLTIEVTYEPNGMHPEDLESILRDIADTIDRDDLLTPPMSTAIVEEWSYRVEDRTAQE